MAIKTIVVLLVGLALASVHLAEAQQATKIPRIGYLGFGFLSSSGSANPFRADAFRQGLRQLGYAEGKDIVIEWRYAEGKLDRLGELAAELVRLKVEVIVTAGPVPTRAAKAATSTIPIVMTQDPDPVGNGFVASLARPGGNITGLSNPSPKLTKRKTVGASQGNRSQPQACGGALESGGLNLGTRLEGWPNPSTCAGSPALPTQPVLVGIRSQEPLEYQFH